MRRATEEAWPRVSETRDDSRARWRAGPLNVADGAFGTDGSSTEDYRGVIDDLTIENKKLKRKLKKYEKLHDSHLKDDKLFEVRIHGLPAAKKRELEETLRKFTASLGSDSFPASGYEGIVPALPTLATHKTGTSSQASLQNADSAYASMSMSGQGSSAAQSGGETSNKRSAPNAALRRQNIHTYLHHIPEGLLPQPSPANMTERMKKKLVVRRLEQVFAGKGAVGGHHHPQQQQEVSQSAARADRAASEGAGRRSRQEGTREAQIMIGHPNNSGLQMDQLTRLYIPAFFINELRIWQDDALVLAMQGGISISEDPNIRFAYVPNGAKRIRVEAKDTEGHLFQHEWPVENSGI